MAKREATITVRLRDRATSGLKKFRNGLNRVVKVAGLAATAFTAISAAVGARFLAGGIRSAGQFDEAMSRVQAVTGATGETLEQMRQKADEAGATTRFTATEAAAGLEELARGGQSAAQAIDTLNPVLNLASGNNQSVAESAQQVITTLNQFGLEAAEAGRVSDVFTRAAQRSAQTAGELAQAMTQAAPVAAQLGLNVEQTTAIIGRLADAGFRGSRGGTALRNALSQLADPASKFRKELGALGITSKDFVEVLEQLEASGGDADKAIRALGLESAPAITALVNSGTADLQKLIRELDNAAGASADAAATMEDNLPGALRALGSAWDAAQRKLAAPLVERIKEEVQAFTGQVREFTNSGVLDRFAQLLVSTFDAAVATIREFVGKIDFKAVGDRLKEFADAATERIRNFGNDAKALQRAFQTTVGSIQILVGGVGLAFNALGTTIAGTIALVNLALEKSLKAMNVFYGGLNPTIARAQHELEQLQLSFNESTAKFASQTATSFRLMEEGWRNLEGTAKTSAASQRDASTEAGDAAEDAAERTGDAADEAADRTTAANARSAVSAEELKETLDRSAAAVRGWGEESGQAADQVRRLDEASGETTTGLIDLGDGLERVRVRAGGARREVEELSGTATTLRQLQAEVAAARTPFERLEEAIAAAADTTDLNLLVQELARAREAGEITAEQYEQLAATLVEQAVPSFDQLRQSIQDATRPDELIALAGQLDNLAFSGQLTTEQILALNAALNESRAVLLGAAEGADAARGSFGGMADEAGRAAEEAGRAAGAMDSAANSARAGLTETQSSGQLGAILQSWRDLGQGPSNIIDQFLATHGGRLPTGRRLELFFEDMERRFGHLREEAGTLSTDIDGIGDNTGSGLRRTIQEETDATRELADQEQRVADERERQDRAGTGAGTGGTRHEVDMNIKFTRDQTEPALLTEQQLNTIVRRVLAEIERARARTF